MKDEIIRIRLDKELKEKIKGVSTDMSKYIRSLILEDLKNNK